MIPTLFADTSGFFAAFSRSDARHHEAVAVLTPHTRLLTTRLIVIETVSLLTKRLSPFHAHAWHEMLPQTPQLEIQEIDPAALDEAEKLWRKNRDKEWDLIDCHSFCVMRNRGVKAAWSFDRHFLQAGFQLAPARF